MRLKTPWVLFMADQNCLVRQEAWLKEVHTEGMKLKADHCHNKQNSSGNHGNV